MSRQQPKRKRAKPKRRELPMTDELTERDFGRLEAAAIRQLERNKRRLEWKPAP